jgi:hypothetical protein
MYRDTDVLITTETLTVRGPDIRRIGLSRLGDIRVHRGRIDEARTVLLFSFALGAIVSASGSWTDPTANRCAVAAVCAVAAALLNVYFPPRPRRYELRATYQGQESVLYASPDRLAVRAMCRALTKAKEHRLRVDANPHG